MPTVSLTLPVAGTVITAGLHATNYTTIQTALNGGLDNNNIAVGAAIVQSKIAFDGWQTYIPTFSASGGGSPALGNATVTARRAQIGKTVVCVARIIVGSTTNFGTGNLQIALPITAAGASGERVGYGDLIDASTNNGVACTAVLISATNLSLVATPTYLGVRTFVSGSGAFPWVWATSDEIAFTLSYEAA